MIYGLNDKQKKIFCRMVMAGVGLVLMVLAILLASNTCYANETLASLTTNIQSKFLEVYTSIGIVVSALATVALGICAFKWILGTDPQSVRQAKQWMLYIVIGIAVYWLADAIVAVVQSMVDDSSTAPAAAEGAITLFVNI